MKTNVKSLNNVIKANVLKEDYSVKDKISSLAKNLDVKESDIEVASYDDSIFIVYGEKEYLVCNADEAKTRAEESIEEIFNELGLEAFSEDFQKWIIENAIDEIWCEDVVEEGIYNEINDLDDEELVEKAIDLDILSEEDAYEEDEDIFETSIKDNIDTYKLRDDVIDVLTHSVLENENSYLDYLIDNYGEEFIVDEININKSIVNIGDVINECIKLDGVAHFLSSYDGKELELDDDLFAYRLN